MLPVRDFVAQLPEDEYRDLADAVGSGLHDARKATECLTDPGPQAETVVHLLAYLSEAIRQLELARDLVRRRA